MRLIKEGIRRKYFQQGSGPGDILNFGMYEGWRCRGCAHLSSDIRWNVPWINPSQKMWKLKCIQVFLEEIGRSGEGAYRQEERMRGGEYHEGGNV